MPPPARPPVSVQVALVEGGIPAAYTAGQLQWLAQRHSELVRHSPSGRDLWHGRWAFTCQDILASVLFAYPTQAPRPPAPPGGR